MVETKGFDCNCKLSYDLAKKFKADGYEFAMRYVGRYTQASFDIDKSELDDILRAGLQIGIVQHCPGKPGILPSGSLGTEYGKNAARFAEEAGYEKGCVVYLDLEDVNIEYKKRQGDILEFCNTWYDEVLRAGYKPGIYVGFNNFLTGRELYFKLKFKTYWKSFSRVPDVYKRGYAMKQLKWLTGVNGIDIDTDEAGTDKLGDSPVFMKREKILTRTVRLYDDGTYEMEVMEE